MKNIKLQYCKHFNTNIKDVKFLLLNPNAGRQQDETFFVVTQSKIFAWNGAVSNGECKELVDLPANIVAVEYLALDNEICLATDVGEVLTINPETLNQNEGTFCDEGIANMAWSPDQEVVVFITKNQNLVVMTSSYEVLAEHSLKSDVEASDLFVNVGWGKKETQFHGSEGKGAAKQSSNFKPPDNIQDLPQNVEISWRADGEYFAVSFVSEQIGRMFKVFDKEGKLNFISEKWNDLEPVLAWRPSGTWIAVPHQLPNKSTVGLFEKNGLRHREINLPFDLKEEPILALKWSNDSDILSIHTKQTASGREKVYFYTISNYYWYLKQTLTFEVNDEVAHLVWDTRMGEEKSLHILLQNGKYYNYSWRFGIDRYQDKGTVGVIDGKKLLFSNFAKSVVPPPICNEALVIENNINVCVFMLNNNICLLDDEQILHFFSKNCDTEVFTRTQKLEPLEKTPLQHLTVCKNEIPQQGLLLATQTTDKNTSKLMLIPLQRTKCSDNNDQKVYQIEDVYEMPNLICALTTGYSLFAEAFIQTLDGQTHLVTVDKLQQIVVECSQNFALSQTIADLQWFGTKCYEKTGLVSLTTKNCLFIDEQQIAEDVTSYCCTGNYLVFTKLSTLHIYHLVESRLVAERKVERGSKLVTIVGVDGLTVLQMPRGNLEAIYPRYLSLEIIKNLLNNEKYAMAMVAIRKQRINFNIMCDHNMLHFIKNIDYFLAVVQKTNLLNLFINDLQNEDFTRTMYLDNYKNIAPQYPADFKIEEKVSYVCKALCSAMQDIWKDNYFIPMITAFVKCGEIEKSLLQIWKQKQAEDVADAGAGVKADEALKYLLYLVDVNDLYNVALGTYDFDLVLFVARKSQKDPKEFLQFLNELQTYPPNYQHFKIDEHLKRYEKALGHIALCGEEKFEESLAFIKKQALYRHALPLYKANEKCYQQICLAFGDYLRSNNCLENASLMYERGGNLQQALLSAKHVLDWERVLKLAKQDQMDLKEVALSMIPSLEEHGKFVVAAELYKNFCDDPEESLKSLLKGKHFLKAIFEARINDKLNQELITESLTAYALLLENEIQRNQDLFSEYKQRLLAVRVEKEQQSLDDCNQPEIDECDLLSDTTSVRSSQFTSSSRGTGKTFRSAKNRRKHARKVLSLKPVNPFEDIALVDALYNLVMQISSLQESIHQNCKALLELEKDDLAATIQKKFKALLQLVEESLDSIWIEEMAATGAPKQTTEPNMDYTKLKKEQRYALLEPVKRFKPQLTFIKWEHEILK